MFIFFLELKKYIIKLIATLSVSSPLHKSRFFIYVNFQISNATVGLIKECIFDSIALF